MTTLSNEGTNDVNSGENEHDTYDGAIPGEVDVSVNSNNDALIEFLNENDLFDMKDQILSSQLRLSHFKLIEKADLDDLCTEIELSTSQRIRLKHSIQLLQKDSIQNESVASIRSKIVIVGEASVGKTTLQKAMMGWEFEEGSKATFAVHSMHKKSTINYKHSHVNIDYELIDTPGLQRFADIITLYLRGALAVIVVYDIVNKLSFERAKWWIEYIENNASGYDKIILIANKTDMKNGTKGASQEDIKQDDDEDLIEAGHAYATEHKIAFLGLSAKYKENVDVLLNWIRKQSKRQVKENPNMIQANQENVHLDQPLLHTKQPGIKEQFMKDINCCY